MKFHREWYFGRLKLIFEKLGARSHIAQNTGYILKWLKQLSPNQPSVKWFFVKQIKTPQKYRRFFSATDREEKTSIWDIVVILVTQTKKYKVKNIIFCAYTIENKRRDVRRKNLKSWAEFQIVLFKVLKPTR